MSPTAALRARLIVFFTIGIAAVLAVALWVVNLPQLVGSAGTRFASNLSMPQACIRRRMSPIGDSK
ncbi:MAG TPA: hypothetical protein VFN32_09030 [Rhodococcus sp. (in: high G+C Gram-positive bacteria)]|nr:hypothetical protein [Rhodococcus sp. (in: high G+C Gram-positive bacteria)]